MGLLPSFKKQEHPEIALAKQNMDLQEKSIYMQSAEGGQYEELPGSEARSDLLKWQQDLDDQVENLKHRLKSEVKVDGIWKPGTMKVQQENKDGKMVTVEVNVPPLCNELFVDYIQSQVEPFLSRNLINSNLTEKRILCTLRYTMDDIADAMADGWNLYGVDFINANLIDRLIKNVITPGPFRALKGWTKRTDATISKRIEGYIEKPEAMKGGLNIWGKK